VDPSDPNDPTVMMHASYNDELRYWTSIKPVEPRLVTVNVALPGSPMPDRREFYYYTPPPRRHS
jgi:hypothetical protein